MTLEGLIARTVFTIVPACLCIAAVASPAPRLYSQPFHQSAVRADPDDLLILGGEALTADDRVVYRALDPRLPTPQQPSRIPTESNATAGLAAVVSAAGAPYQLVIRMPRAIIARRPYELWVVNSSEQWSNAARINDPRPLWISPSRAYSTARTAFLPREIKVIGRNLRPADGDELQVRLQGPRQYVLHSSMRAAPTRSLAEFTTIGRLPDSLQPGKYAVELSVDGRQWTRVSGQELSVLPDPRSRSEFSISNAAFGRCSANDGRDDTACLRSALQAAADHGGGIVSLGRETWDLRAGILVLGDDVELRGEGVTVTRVLRHDPASTLNDGRALFTMLSRTGVRDVTFADARQSEPGDRPRPILQLGRVYSTDLHPGATPVPVDDIIITHNVFERTNVAIVDGGSAIRNLFITHNLFGDYRLALELGGNRFNTKSALRIHDSVITYNDFKPGSYLDVKNGQGAMASELGASMRVDFSSNNADGADTRFLNSRRDAPGWRAAFFFHMNNNHEMLLISENTISCSGDKAGDGEAISLDGNANTFALPAARAVIAATPQTVNISGTLNAAQNNRSVDPRDYYTDHWIRVVAGPGLGQSRKITSYDSDPTTGASRFVIDPAWDVVPLPGASTITIAREFWQTMILANRVDQRSPPCIKGNRTRPKGGSISVWGQSSDTVVAGNEQFDTDGILFQQAYGAQDSRCAQCAAMTTIPSALEIRANLIDGEYDWNSACSLSGISGSYAAAPSLRFPTPLLSVGVSISHNRISHADGLFGGGIGIVPTWYKGAPGGRKPLLSGIIIHHNLIEHVAGRAPHAACGYAQTSRAGIRLSGHAHLEATVLYMNACEDVAVPLLDEGSRTLAVCDTVPLHSCECAP